MRLHDCPATYHDLQLNVSQSFVWTDAKALFSRGKHKCPIQQLASLKCPDWRLTLSIRSTSCLAERVPRGLKMESSRATPCHLDTVDLGAGLSARTAECIKCCISTFKYRFQLLSHIFCKASFSSVFLSFHTAFFLREAEIIYIHLILSIVYFLLTAQMEWWHIGIG